MALIEQDELESMAQIDLLLSSEVLAAVIIGNHQPAICSWPCEFPLLHQERKILLQGFLINFGQKKAGTATSKKCIDKEFDPLTYAFSVIEGLQQAMVSNSSRKFFNARREVAKENGITWHAFRKGSGQST